MGTGVVKWFDSAKGYGFIQSNEGGSDLFVHFTNIVGDGFRSLVENDTVEFQSAEGRRGPEALNVVLVERASEPAPMHRPAPVFAARVEAPVRREPAPVSVVGEERPRDPRPAGRRQGLRIAPDL